MTALQLCRRKMVKNSCSSTSANNNLSLITSTSKHDNARPTTSVQCQMPCASAQLCWMRNRVLEERESHKWGEELHCRKMRGVICAGKVPVGKRGAVLGRREPNNKQMWERWCSPTKSKFWPGKGWWGAGVLISIPNIDSPHLRQLWDVRLPTGVAQCLTSMWQRRDVKLFLLRQSPVSITTRLPFLSV